MSNITNIEALQDRIEKLEQENLKLKQSLANRKVYTELAKLAPYPVMIHADGEVLQLSNVWTEITGYTIEDIPTIEIWSEKAYGKDSIPSKEFIYNLYNIDSIQNDGEWTIQLKNGDTRIWEFSTSPVGILPDGRRMVISVGVDITERKSIEERIQRGSKLLNEIGNLAKIGGWELDVATMTRYMTEPTFKIYEIDNGITPNGVEVLSYFPTEVHEIIIKRYGEAIRNGTPFDIELPFISAKGTKKWVKTIGRAQKENGKVVKLYGAIQDITAQRAINEELKTAKEKAEQSDKLKSAFLTNMSHEIRTPMNGILGFSELLKLPNLSGEEQQKYIGIIEKSGKRMLNIINDIVDISKIEAGLMKVDLKTSYVNEQVEYIYSFFKNEVDQKGIDFSYQTELSTEESAITSDREKIFAILTNLVKNAIKYTNSGTISFGYTVVNNEKGSFLQFFVKDTGIGIPGNRQQEVFKRFIQADISNKMAHQGAGLGLAITKAYVTMLGGEIWVESIPNEGSTFFFTLPYLGKSEKVESVEDIIFPVKTNSFDKDLKILYVEDDKISERLFDLRYKMFGDKIIKARNGVEAVEACRNNPDIDLILMDIQMPLLNGYEATKQIRQFNANVVIIAQTAFADNEAIEKAMVAGCNAYISKPFNEEALFTLLNKHF